MKSAVQVASPPPKPLLIFDGDCHFCSLWVARWQQSTGERVDYLPLQEPRVAAQFPELSREQLERAVHLVLPEGTIVSGAEAVLRALAAGPHGGWLLDWYEHSPIFARASEGLYRFVAGHRRFFSSLTGLVWGLDSASSTYQWVGWLFLRSLGVVYLIAFLSLWVQILGLVGHSGILPAHTTLAAVQHQAEQAKLGWERFRRFPTLCWFSTSDACLRAQCAAGAVLAVVLILGIAPAPCLFLLWMLYLSLVTIGREFLGFQWDALLLETGFLALFLAPLQFWPRPGRTPPPSRLVLWLLRWLLFRLMFESGCVKLLSHDPTWRHLTALSYHYQTQPLPTWLGWYAYQLPGWFHRASTLVMFVIELGLPVLIFAPRRLRQVPCVGFILLQVLILLTGNYGFFNLLTIALCLLLLDDAALLRLAPARWVPVIKLQLGKPAAGRRWPRGLLVALSGAVLGLSLMQFPGFFGLRIPWPTPMRTFQSWAAPFQSLNSYGLFQVMTTSRPEIIVEGSNDGQTWRPYAFEYKPGELKQRPGFVEPHMPRLDWQMWFAALGTYRQNPWFVNFCVRLLEGAPQTLALLADNPFPKAPPRYVRAVLYDYRFTDWATRRRTGAWWQRTELGQYLPPISLRQ